MHEETGGFTIKDFFVCVVCVIMNPTFSLNAAICIFK